MCCAYNTTEAIETVHIVGSITPLSPIQEDTGTSTLPARQVTRRSTACFPAPAVPGQLVASFLSWYHMGQLAHLSTRPQVPGLNPSHLLVGAARRCPLPLTLEPGLFSGSQQGLLISLPAFWLL